VKRIKYDLTCLTSEAIGPTGLSTEDIEGARERLEHAVEYLAELGTAHEPNFMHMPDEAVADIQLRAAQLQSRFETMVVLGIGGSSLGARAAIEGLIRRRSGRFVDGTPCSGLRVQFIENVDASDLLDLLETVDLETTVFNVVTKSGNTIETMSAFLIIRERLINAFGMDGYRERVICTTDPTRGALRGVIAKDELEAWDVPPGVGGRFSVMSPVGLIPIAAAGVDIEAFLRGAARALASAVDRNVLENPAALFALTQTLLYERGRTQVVFMPYATSLFALGQWFAQLWAESLGKLRYLGDETPHHVGPTPIAALGATDQHSLLQLFMEGDDVRNIVFVEVGDTPDAPSVPSTRSLCEPIVHLGGKSLDEIRSAELCGVREGLVEHARPSSTFTLDRLDAEYVGGLMMTLMCSTVVAGSLFDVNPFDQPGVELGKRFAHGLLGRDKERHYASQIHERIAARRTWIVTV